MHIFIMDMMNSFGYIGIALLIMIENLFPPIPSEVILTFGGFMTTYTHLTVGGVVFFFHPRFHSLAPSFFTTLGNYSLRKN